MPKIKYVFKWQKMIWPTLPSEYQRVEYIQSSWSQYIDSWYTPTTKSTIECDFQYTSLVQWVRNFWIWSDTTTSAWSTWGFYLWDSASKHKVWSWNGTNWTDVWNNPLINADTNRYVFIQTASTWAMYNTSWTQVAKVTVKSVITQNANHSLWLFSNRDVWYNAFRNFSSWKMYYCKMYEDWILKRYFIPCYRISDNVAWLYDLVEWVFYTNKGSWVFSKWPDAIQLPSTYQRVEYIQSSASSQWATSSSWQYIDTWFTPTSNTKIYTDFAYTSTTVQWRMYWIQTESSSYMTFDTYINWSWYYARAMIDWSWNRVATTISADTNRHEFILDKSWYKIYTNWSQVYSAWNDATPTKNCGHTLPLFARWMSTESSTTYNKICQHSSARLYSCKIWDNWTLVRHFVPCYRKSDNVIWLYDIVGWTFYTNQWSWSFTKWGNI